MCTVDFRMCHYRWIITQNIVNTWQIHLHRHYPTIYLVLYNLAVEVFGHTWSVYLMFIMNIYFHAGCQGDDTWHHVFLRILALIVTRGVSVCLCVNSFSFRSSPSKTTLHFGRIVLKPKADQTIVCVKS